MATERADYFTYAWFTDSHYGTNLEFSCLIDTSKSDQEIINAIQDNKKWQESHSKYLKDRNIAGHVLYGTIIIYGDQTREINVKDHPRYTK
jgi:hypothetical protein